jgi:hypothetical protein
VILGASSTWQGVPVAVGERTNIDKKMVVAGIVFLCAFRDGDDSVTSSLTLVVLEL